MTNKRLFRLRRALLAALLEYSSYQDLDTVMLHPVVIGENASPEELRVEWRNLTEWGMIEPLAGYQGAVCRLTAANPGERWRRPATRRETPGFTASRCSNGRAAE